MDFVNTADLEDGTDALGTPQALAAWLRQSGLAEPSLKLGAEDLRAASALREALRSMLAAHNGGPRDAAAEAELEAVARRGGLTVGFGGGDSLQLVPSAGGFDGALAALLVPVAQGIADGSWRRAKACRAEHCRWAFYDRSRNRSGTWCEMAVCGNREKVRAYRHRGAAG